MLQAQIFAKQVYVKKTDIRKNGSTKNCMNARVQQDIVGISLSCNLSYYHFFECQFFQLHQPTKYLR